MNKFSKSLIAAALATLLAGGFVGVARGVAAVQVPARFTITGSGFGHGVGMSQYGAQGMGLDGFTASEILKHYYSGTTVNAVALPAAKIRVGLLQDQAVVAVRGEQVPGKLTGGAFNVVIDDLTPIPIKSGSAVTFTTLNGSTLVASDGVTLGSGAKVTLIWVNADTVIHVKSATKSSTAVSKLGTLSCAPNACSNRYRYGTLEIFSGTFDDEVADLVVVNVLRISDQYLFGLGEVPSSWSEAAMQAQAIAGRSYAVKKTKERSGCACQIYASTLDQSFIGYSKEVGTSGSRWVTAVKATIVDRNTAYVVRYKGSIISTYYSSSTGGKSQPTAEVWGSAFPYLVSVDDHWSQDPRVNNSNSTWTETVDQVTLVSKLQAQGVVIADVASMTVGGNYLTGGISKLNLSDSAGNFTTLSIAPGQPVTPDELRGVLGTKSTYISSITPGIATVAGSTTATAKKLVSVTKVNWPTSAIKPTDYNFTGKVSPAQVGATVKLQKRVGGKWKTVSTAVTNSEGSWAILWIRPQAGNHDLRIAASNSKGTIKTSTKQVKMAGVITASAPKAVKRKTSFTVSGSVNPGYEGVTVIVERKVGNGSWVKISKVKTDSLGNWSLTRTTGSSKMTVSYRAKTSDSRLGVLVSKAKTTRVK